MEDNRAKPDDQGNKVLLRKLSGARSSLINILPRNSLKLYPPGLKIGILRTEMYFLGNCLQDIHERYETIQIRLEMPKIAGHVAAKYICGCGFVIREIS
jgi:hypothetical protein